MSKINVLVFITLCITFTLEADFFSLHRQASESIDTYDYTKSETLLELVKDEIRDDIRKESLYIALQGRLFFETGRYIECINIYQQVDYFAMKEVSMYFISLSYHRLNDMISFSRELSELEKYILETSPNASDFWNNYTRLALLYLINCNYEMALKNIDLALSKQGGGNNTNYLIKSIIQYRSKNYADAYNTINFIYNSKDRISLLMVESMLWKSLIYSKYGLLEESAKICKDALAINTTLPSTNRGLKELLSIRKYYINVPDEIVTDLMSIINGIESQE